ncbi:alpha/beta fold hydrolase [Magnetococcus sp. PR-3]|uniref:alpha/beta fold hydrolase n=1 Tax=Magnetococcus sp. PR-3 TaxID=3120355 RepID=UPI002FCE3BA1
MAFLLVKGGVLMDVLSSFHHQVAGENTQNRWVFLHGLMGSGNNWRKIVRALQSDRQILTYDQRGHGRSFKPRDGYALEDYAEDLKALLDALDWQKIVLVGHSLGGRVAMTFAHLYPERLQGLVIVDIGPGGHSGAADRTVQLLEMVPTPFESKEAAKLYFETEFPHQALAAGWEKVETLGPYLYSNLIEHASGEADWRFYKPGIVASVARSTDRARWDQIEALNRPTLLMRGQSSRYLPRDTFDAMVACNPCIEGVEISAADHWVHADQPEQFVAQLQRFNQQLQGG